MIKALKIKNEKRKIEMENNKRKFLGIVLS